MKSATLVFTGWAPNFESNRGMIEHVLTNRTRSASVLVNKRAGDKDRERKVEVTVIIKDA